jgi:hypothetical protein
MHINNFLNLEKTMSTKFAMMKRTWEQTLEDKPVKIVATYKVQIEPSYRIVDLKSLKWEIQSSELRSEDREVPYEEIKRLFPTNTPAVDRYDGTYAIYMAGVKLGAFFGGFCLVSAGLMFGPLAGAVQGWRISFIPLPIFFLLAGIALIIRYFYKTMKKPQN